LQTTKNVQAANNTADLLGLDLSNSEQHNGATNNHTMTNGNHDGQQPIANTQDVKKCALIFNCFFFVTFVFSCAGLS
jgi:hypothetical protein